VAQPEVIYAHARNLTSEFFTDLLKMHLNVVLKNMKTTSFCVPTFWLNTGVWRMDGRTDLP